MLKTYLQKLGKALIFSTLLTSCHNLNWYHEPQAAKEALNRQEMEKRAPVKEAELSEQGSKQLIISIPHEKYPKKWDKETYETVEEWTERIQLTLEVNDSDVKEFQAYHDSLNEKEKSLSSHLEYLLAQNEVIRKQLDYYTGDSDEDMFVEESTFRQYEKPPFLIHLVRPGETLFGISMKYYGTGERVNDIILWNQGWIQHPRSLPAGLTLALFFDFEKEQGQKVVDQYIQTIMTEDAQ